MIAHENIVEILDCGHTDGQPYFIMEFLEGETLGEAVGRGPSGTDLAISGQMRARSARRTPRGSSTATSSRTTSAGSTRRRGAARGEDPRLRHRQAPGRRCAD